MTSLFCSSYETIKYVKVKDGRLGLLRFLLTIGIVLYVGVSEMLSSGGYLEKSRVVGVVRFSLQQPTKDGCDPSKKGCTNAFVPLDTHSYCQQGQEYHNDYSGTVYPCHIFEAENAQRIRETSIVVWTRASIQEQFFSCDGSGSEMICPRTYNSSSEGGGPFYIAQSEAFTVLFEHSVTASTICETHQHIERKKKKLPPPHYTCSAQASSYQKGGRLLSISDELCQEEAAAHSNSYVVAHGTNERQHQQRYSHAPCFIGANRTYHGQDFFSVDVLLQAAGVSMDDCIDDHSPCETYRESGATLLLTIIWNDFLPYQGLVEPFYYYKPQIIATSYKEKHAFYTSTDGPRTLFSSHGIKVAVVMGGNFHSFTWLNFLITTTTALGLLAVATAVVDACMLYVLPEKERYQEAKYEQVTEFLVIPAESSSKEQARHIDSDIIEEREVTTVQNEPLLHHHYTVDNKKDDTTIETVVFTL